MLPLLGAADTLIGQTPRGPPSASWYCKVQETGALGTPALLKETSAPAGVLLQEHGLGRGRLLCRRSRGGKHGVMETAARTGRKRGTAGPEELQRLTPGGDGAVPCRELLQAGPGLVGMRRSAASPAASQQIQACPAHAPRCCVQAGGCLPALSRNTGFNEEGGRGSGLRGSQDGGRLFSPVSSPCVPAALASPGPCLAGSLGGGEGKQQPPVGFPGRASCGKAPAPAAAGALSGAELPGERWVRFPSR